MLCLCSWLFHIFFFCLLGSPVAATSVGFDVCSAGCSPRWLQALGAPCLSFPCEPGCPHLGSSLGPSQHSGCLRLSVTPLFSAVFQPKSRMSARKSISKCCNKPVASLSFFLMLFFSADFDPRRAKASQSLVCSEVVGQGWMPRCVFSLEVRGFGNPVLFGNCLEARSSSGAAWCLGTAVTRDGARSHCRAPALLISPRDLP